MPIEVGRRTITRRRSTARAYPLWRVGADGVRHPCEGARLWRGDGTEIRGGDPDAKEVHFASGHPRYWLTDTDTHAVEPATWVTTESGGYWARGLRWEDPVYYEVEGAGPDKFVSADCAEDAARVACEVQVEGTLDRLAWLDGGADATTIARYEWRAGDSVGRVTVRKVNAEMTAALDAVGLDEDDWIEAATVRGEGSR